MKGLDRALDSLRRAVGPGRPVLRELAALVLGVPLERERFPVHAYLVGQEHAPAVHGCVGTFQLDLIPGIEVHVPQFGLRSDVHEFRASIFQLQSDDAALLAPAVVGHPIRLPHRINRAANRLLRIAVVALRGLILVVAGLRARGSTAHHEAERADITDPPVCALHLAPLSMAAALPLLPSVLVCQAGWHPRAT